jgi:hypothetical protein
MPACLHVQSATARIERPLAVARAGAAPLQSMAPPQYAARGRDACYGPYAALLTPQKNGSGPLMTPETFFRQA